MRSAPTTRGRSCRDSQMSRHIVVIKVTGEKKIIPASAPCGQARALEIRRVSLAIKRDLSCTGRARSGSRPARLPWPRGQCPGVAVGEDERSIGYERAPARPMARSVPQWAAKSASGPFGRFAAADFGSRLRRAGATCDRATRRRRRFTAGSARIAPRALERNLPSRRRIRRGPQSSCSSLRAATPTARGTADCGATAHDIGADGSGHSTAFVTDQDSNRRGRMRWRSAQTAAMPAQRLDREPQTTSSWRRRPATRARWSWKTAIRTFRRRAGDRRGWWTSVLRTFVGLVFPRTRIP